MMDRRSATRRFLVERMVLRENGKSGALHRVVHVDDECNRVWLFDLSEMTWPEPFDRDELLNGFETSPPLYAIEYEEPYPAHLAQDEDLSASGKVHDRNWDIVEHLLGGDRGKALLEKRSRKERIDATIVAKETTRQTVVALLRRFWERGLSRAALRPDYANCGGPGKSRSIASGAKVGRPRTISPGVGSSVNDDMRRIFHIGADYYLRLKKPSQQAALNYIVNIFYSDRLNEAGKIKIHLEDGRPTLKQFSHFLRTFYPENVRFKARHGQKKFDLEGRALTGRADQNAKGPGDEFQIDATIADVYLRSQFDRRRIVGRPVIYCAIDVWSRLITGIYVGFEGPSWIGAMMVLTNMVTPKVEFCRQYGIEIDPDEWPAHHAPRSILADRGELLSVRLGHRIVDTLHINIGKTPEIVASLREKWRESGHPFTGSVYNSLLKCDREWVISRPRVNGGFARKQLRVQVNVEKDEALARRVRTAIDALRSNGERVSILGISRVLQQRLDLSRLRLQPSTTEALHLGLDAPNRTVERARELNGLIEQCKL